MVDGQYVRIQRDPKTGVITREGISRIWEPGKGCRLDFRDFYTSFRGHPPREGDMLEDRLKYREHYILRLFSGSGSNSAPIMAAKVDKSTPNAPKKEKKAPNPPKKESPKRDDLPCDEFRYTLRIDKLYGWDIIDGGYR